MSQKLSVKVKILPGNEIRRFGLEGEITLTSLLCILIKIVKVNDREQFDNHFVLKYEDDEKDIVTIDTDEEFSEAVYLQRKKDNKLLNFILLRKVSSSNSACGLTSKRKNWIQLHREALKLFESNLPHDLEKARQLLIQQSLLTPSHPTTLYNLACIESRLGNIDQGIKYLHEAIKHGYKDLEHIRKDTDLDSLRNNEQFINLISNLEKNEKSKCSHAPYRRCWERKKNWWILERKIQSLFNSGSVNDLNLARNLILEQMSIFESAHSVYNLACVESLLKNEKSAVEHLRRAIDLGFKDGEHIDKDSDLDFIRNTAQFEELRKKLQTKAKEEKKEDSTKKTEQKEDASHTKQSEEIDYSRLVSILADMGFQNINTPEIMQLLHQTNGYLDTILLPFSQ